MDIRRHLYLKNTLTTLKCTLWTIVIVIRVTTITVRKRQITHHKGYAHDETWISSLYMLYTIYKFRAQKISQTQDLIVQHYYMQMYLLLNSIYNIIKINREKKCLNTKTNFLSQTINIILQSNCLNLIWLSRNRRIIKI